MSRSSGSLFGTFLTLGLVWLAVCVIALAGLAYAVIHFVAKFW